MLTVESEVAAAPVPDDDAIDGGARLTKEPRENSSGSYTRGRGSDVESSCDNANSRLAGALSVKELRELIRRAGLSDVTRGVEKAELRALAKARVESHGIQ